MNIKQNYKEKIKIKDLAYLNELGAEIVEFYPKNDLLEGKLYVTGNYRSSKNDVDKLISHDIPFTIVFDSDDFLIEDIECISFNYNLIEGAGVEIEYEIAVTYSTSDDSNHNEEILEEVKEENVTLEQVERKIEIDNNLISDDSIADDVIYDDNEQIKEEITKSVEQMLESKLELVNNLPQEEIVTRSFKEEKSNIKIVYYQNEKELDQIAKNNHCSIDSLYKQNKKNNINTFKRVIIKNE